ncbi:hypothetical protein E0L36_16565 [Streptomyces sp. AJS327]|uniref:hypothetical protein n=1 Tax=Streptomyces sp. AJS327 TaxID=2545265 RepID=UPI0015DED7D7|nr:hypothetical protein [Streptomyces sp. AJS327]MBA0052467.1 hypothetical protein [Streptomyces sp. AJS327]
MSYPQTAPRQDGAVPHPGAAPAKKPGAVVAMLVLTALAALSGALGALLVYAGGKDLADENIRNAVDNNPETVGLPAGTTAADIKAMSGPMWDEVISDWQSTMSSRAHIAMFFAVVLLLALAARRCAIWPRVLITLTVLIWFMFPHALVLRDDPPNSLFLASMAAVLVGFAALVACWLPGVNRYRKELRAH